MKTRLLILISIWAMGVGCKPATQRQPVSSTRTFCNPMDLNYRFCLDEPSRREAADPTIVRFQDKYFLFASKSGGYWYSDDLLDWTLVETDQIPVEDYAPTAIAIGDTLYFMASSHVRNAIYRSADPISGQWDLAVAQIEKPMWDPAFFMDDDQRLYVYWGCSNENPLYGVEVDYKNDFALIGEPVALKYPNTEDFGWEVPGDYNTLIEQAPWIEGAWVNKINGKYYLQYSGPGTEFKSYSDGVYVAENPLGPYEPQAHNPFAYKPEGFAAGAGHGSTFQDEYGNYWHIGTMTISQKHMFERRLGLFPAFVDASGTLYADTRFGDYPMKMPEKKIDSAEELFTNWLPLSVGKAVEVSSSIDSLPAANVTDEDIRTYWAAASGEAGEYAILDLGAVRSLSAVQLNFAEHATGLFGRQEGRYHRYLIEASDDMKSWRPVADRSQAQDDNVHQYIVFDDVLESRYLKVTNVEVPDGHFAISGFRAFGERATKLPAIVTGLEVSRDSLDRRKAVLNWSRSERAEGYQIRYGVSPDQLYQSYQVYSDTMLTIRSLNANLSYYFSIEAFNSAKLTTQNSPVKCE